MTFTEAHKQLIRDSWDVAKTNAGNDLGVLGVKMFVRLFTEYPDLKSTFPFAKGKDIEQIKESPRVRKHGAGVFSTVDTAVGALGDMDAVAGVLTALGKKHKNYNVTPDHFTPVGEALVWTLADTAGAAFTDDVRDAWGTLFGIITDVMSAQLT